MEETPAAGKPASATPTRTSKSPARRRTASGTRKSPARKRSAGRKRTRRRSGANGFSALLNEMASKAAAAGKELKAISGKGAGAARKAWSEVGMTSRRTISRLTKEWEAMDSTRRAQFIAALLAALAAASAPIVRGRLKK
jgi:hypothetical protein